MFAQRLPQPAVAQEPPPNDRFIGLMSGTSLDGVDGVLVDFSGTAPQVLAHAYAAFDADFANELLQLNTSGPDEVHRSALAANQLVRSYAGVVAELLARTGTPAVAVQAIGAHGQTIRHRPQEFDGTGYTVQLNNPALLAELTGIDVVADFRSRDVAAGGQGAPLVPAFHQAFFGAAADGPVAVLNIGGISNLSLLAPAGTADEGPRGFDCGPGNALLDHWCRQHTGHPMDRDGAWSARGRVQAQLLDTLLTEPYLAKNPPKSTGRDLFNTAWLQQRLAGFPTLAPVDVQATLCAFTARVCADDLRRHAPDTRQLIVCGGGALNIDLMARLQRELPGVVVQPSAARGLPPLQVEATAFAWLARQALRRAPGNQPKTTGARGARILGAVYPR